jgi:hypothetical protein
VKLLRLFRTFWGTVMKRHCLEKYDFKRHIKTEIFNGIVKNICIFAADGKEST